MQDTAVALAFGLFIAAPFITAVAIAAFRAGGK
jgi:hypothetical protein